VLRLVTHAVERDEIDIRRRAQHLHHVVGQSVTDTMPHLSEDSWRVN
jgi:hypothetical protein